MVWLAAVCPSDPFDGFFAWVGCSFLKSIGIDPNAMNGDLVSNLLSGQLPQTHGSCSGLLESFMGHSCVTYTLWQMTEAAAFPIIVVMLGARFARVLTQNEFQLSPGWAIADPVLRAVVAATFVTLSFDVLVYGHAQTELIATLIFQNITSAGGVTGAGLVFPSEGGTFLLTDIVYWLYSIYIFFLIIATTIGYEICIVLAPLVIPFWVYSGQHHVFAWFAKTVVGALALLIGVSVGWGVVIDIVHSVTTLRGNAPYVGVGGWLISIIFIAAGVWFMTKFVKATTGELVSAHPLATMAIAGAALTGLSRTAGATMPSGARAALSRRVLASRVRGLLPAGVRSAAEGYMGGRMGRTLQLAQWMERSGPARHVAAQVLGPSALRRAASARLNGAFAALKANNPEDAAQLLTTFTPERIQELSVDALMRSDPATQEKLYARVLTTPAGLVDNGGWRSRRLAEQGNDYLKDILKDPVFSQRVEELQAATGYHVPSTEVTPDMTLRHLGVTEALPRPPLAARRRLWRRRPPQSGP